MTTNAKNPTTYDRKNLQQMQEYYKHTRQTVFVTAVPNPQKNGKLETVPTAIYDRM